MCYHVYILIWLKMLTISGAYFGMHFSWSIKTLSEKTVNRVPNYRKVQATMGIWEANPLSSPKGMFILRGSCPCLQGTVSWIKT